MYVTVENRSVTPAHEAEFEVVERKGIGHPDSMADILAEEFSRRYSRYGLDMLGIAVVVKSNETCSSLGGLFL